MVSAATLPESVQQARNEFTHRLVNEHLEEASFLYEQHAYLHSDPAAGWRAVENTEERIAGHLAALRRIVSPLDGDLAEPGTVYALLRLSCQRGDLEQATAVLAAIFPRDGSPTTPEFDDGWETTTALPLVDGLPQEAKPEVTGASTTADTQKDEVNPLATAAFAAFKDDIPEPWLCGREGSALHDYRGVSDLLWRVCGYRRRRPSANTLIAPDPASPGYCFYVGRLKARDSLGPVMRVIKAPAGTSSGDAATALLRLGDRSVCELAEGEQPPPWAAIALALAGTSEEADALSKTPMEKMDRTTVLALGLLGQISAVTPLIAALADERLAEPASFALHLITGAALREDVVVADEESVNRLSQNPEDWTRWTSANLRRLDSRLRWRAGKPYSPNVLYDCLCDPLQPAFIRDLVAEEMAVRYAIDLPFEPNMPVTRQVAILATAQRSVVAKKFVGGQWYFAGEPL